MNARHKDFNKYLVKSGLFEGLTDTLVKLFMMEEADRPENAVWYIQQNLVEELPPDFPSWTEYQTLLRKLDNLRRGKPENEGEEEVDNYADANSKNAVDPNAIAAADGNGVPVPDQSAADADNVTDPDAEPVADPNDPPAE